MALEKYQVAERLTVTGLLDGETWSAWTCTGVYSGAARDLPVRSQ
jgi:hypothetical protein